MKCRYCGHELKADSKFCIHCGAPSDGGMNRPLRNDGAPSGGGMNRPFRNDGAPSGGGMNRPFRNGGAPTEARQGEKRGSWWKMLLFGVGCAAAGFLLCWFLLGGGTKSEEELETERQEEIREIIEERYSSPENEESVNVMKALQGEWTADGGEDSEGYRLIFDGADEYTYVNEGTVLTSRIVVSGRYSIDSENDTIYLFSDRALEASDADSLAENVESAVYWYDSDSGELILSYEGNIYTK